MRQRQESGACVEHLRRLYLCGGGGEKISRLRPGSGFGFGLGAFLTSFLPLSLFPMRASMTQMAACEKGQNLSCNGLGNSIFEGHKLKVNVTTRRRRSCWNVCGQSIS